MIGNKRAMVKKMTEAASVPMFGYGDEICMDELIRVRHNLKRIADEKYGTKLTYLPFMLKATSLALENYPSLNGHVNEDCTELIHRASHNLGIAVDSPDGLIVPNMAVFCETLFHKTQIKHAKKKTCTQKRGFVNTAI